MLVGIPIMEFASLVCGCWPEFFSEYRQFNCKTLHTAVPLKPKSISEKKQVTNNNFNNFIVCAVKKKK